MKRLLLCLVCILYTASGACGQSNSRSLLRIERAQPGETVCALVNDNGSYRLEKILQAKSEMYTGSIAPERMDQLRTMLVNQQLSKLSQADIHNPLIADTGDDLQIAIRRGRSWQELLFFSGGRKPFKESIDPLLHWFQDLQKQRPSATRVEGPRTRCMPMPESQIVESATSATLTPSTVATAAIGYIFRINSSHYYNGRVDTVCTVVFGDGRFHWERGGQTYGANRRDKIAEGQLDSKTLQQARDLLNSPELKDSPGNPRDAGRPMFEGSWTELEIPREGKVQNLSFLTSFNTLGTTREVGGTSNLTYHVADRKLLEPLTEWMKQHTDKHAQGTETDGVGSDCHPSPTAVQADKSPK